MNSVDRSIPPSRFHADIHSAQTWQDLEVICSRMDAAYLQGRVAFCTVEGLCKLVSQRASELTSYGMVSAADLVDRSPQCDCCGSSTWRDNGGQIICVICHPDPFSGLQRRQAA